MLKKKLIKQSEELFLKLNETNKIIEEQEKIINTQKKEISELKQKIEELNNLFEQQSVVKENIDENIPEEHTVEEEQDLPADELNITDYASSVIGKIVIEATKKSNQISAEGATSENKELINLILGRTEVAKSEILNIVLSNDTNSNKKIAIDKVYFDSCEYFKSVLLQYS